MNKTMCVAAGALAAGLSGCVMLPPPPPFGPPPAYAQQGAMPPPEHHRGPPPAFAKACLDQPAGARVTLTGPRGEALAGTCEPGPEGRVEFRPEPRQRP